jgi:hypothetical protein
MPKIGVLKCKFVENFVKLGLNQYILGVFLAHFSLLIR